MIASTCPCGGSGHYEDVANVVVAVLRREILAFLAEKDAEAREVSA